MRPRLRLGDEVYTAPFNADTEGDIIDADGRMTHVRAIEGADVIARAMSVLVANEQTRTDEFTIKCHWCEDVIDTVEARRHATDEERLEDALAYIKHTNSNYRPHKPVDVTFWECWDTPYCSEECFNGERAESAIVGGDDLSEREQ